MQEDFVQKSAISILNLSIIHRQIVITLKLNFISNRCIVKKI